MKTIARIMFNGKKYPGGASSALAASHCEDMASVEYIASLKREAVHVDVLEDDPRRELLHDLLKRHGVTWLEHVFDVHSPEELLTARLLLLFPNRECEVDGGPHFGTMYDLARGCKQCGAGSPQTSPLIVSGEEVASLRDAVAAETYHHDIMVREHIATALIDAGLTGLDLRLVFESLGHTQRRLPFRQIRALASLPPMSSCTTGLIRDRVCPVCQRNGYARTPDEPTRPAYSEADLRDAQDVNATWECFGYSILEPELRDSLIAQPRLLISPKVLKIFMDHGITAFDYYPIRIDDSA